MISMTMTALIPATLSSHPANKTIYEKPEDRILGLLFFILKIHLSLFFIRLMNYASASSTYLDTANANAPGPI